MAILLGLIYISTDSTLYFIKVKINKIIEIIEIIEINETRRGYIKFTPIFTPYKIGIYKITSN